MVTIAPAAGTGTDLPTFETQWVNLADIDLNDLNVRLATSQPALVRSLRANGPRILMQPITVRRDGDKYKVVDGHKRVKSFEEAGLPQIPATIRTDLTDDIDQVVGMLNTANQATPLTTAEHLNGVRQLTLMGLDETEVAKRTGAKKADAAKAVKAATMAVDVIEAASASGLDLVQTAALTEFADDDKVQEALLAEAQRGPLAFERAVEYRRKERKTTAEIATRTAALTESGVSVLTEAPDEKTAALLRDLRSDNKPITTQDHHDCPGHAVSVTSNYLNTVVETYFCTNWRAHGHTNTATGVKGTMSAEAKAVRKRVIENNKEMEAANEVRRKWLADVLKAKDAKPAVTLFVTETLVRHRSILAQPHMGNYNELLTGWLPTKSGRITVPGKVPAGRATVMNLAVIAAAYESRITKDSWRKSKNSGLWPDHQRWLTFLKQHMGFTPGDVEQLIIDDIDGEKAATPEKTTTISS